MNGPTDQALRVRATCKRGSSWPVIVDTSGGPCWTKLRGAGQGLAALVAEVIVAALAEALGLEVPARLLVRVDGAVAFDDPDPELVALVDASRGLNLGFEILEGARDFRADDVDRVGADQASTVVWLDGLVQNPDRTVRNPNLLVRKDGLWLIDHGAALGFHHRWSAVTEQSPRRAAFSRSSHVLGRRATAIDDWDPVLAGVLDRATVREAVAAVPDDFLLPLVGDARALGRRREAYVAFLWKRLKAPRPFVDPGATAVCA